MRGIRLFSSLALMLLTAGAGLSLAATYGTFGTVVPLNPGGTPSDIALDEQRGLLYIADFGSGTIDIMSLADNTIHSSINVAPYPAAIAISPSGTYLVSVHYASYAATSTTGGTVLPGGGNLATVINLNTLAQTTFSFGSESPLGVTFVNQQSGDQGGIAVIVTSANIWTLNPETGQMAILQSLAEVLATIPQPAPAQPGAFTEAAMGTSADGWTAWAITGGGTGTELMMWYDFLHGGFGAQGWITPIALLPRIAVNRDGSRAMVSYAQFNANIRSASAINVGINMAAKYPDVIASKTVTGVAWDSVHNLIYADFPDLNQTTQPALLIMNSANLAYVDRLNLQEDLVGRALLDKAATTMYAVSQSGVTVLPVGSLNTYNRVYPGQEDVLIQTSFCNQAQSSQTFTLADPGGNATDFEITTKSPGISVSPASGRTPATITVTASAGAFTGAQGTSVGSLIVSSALAVNQPIPVRVLVNNPDEDQRGTIVNVPGVLSDVLADPVHNYFYILREDRDQLLVFNAATAALITTLPTMTTPTGMAMAPDPYSGEVNKYLLVANADSQLISVFNLDTLTVGSPITLPGSDFGRSVAVANNAILALSANGSTSDGDVSVLSLITGLGTAMPTVGPWSNNAGWISENSMLVASPNGANVLMAGPDGHVSLYSAAAGTFTASRADLTAISGAYAASSYNTYVVGNTILNSSLVPIGTLSVGGGSPSGFTFIDQNGAASGYFTTSPKPGTTGPGVTQYFASLGAGVSNSSNPIPTVESSILPSGSAAATTSIYPSPDGTVSNNGSGANFVSQMLSLTRTVATLPNSQIVELSTSGFTMLGQGYADAFQPPVLNAITNAANGKAPVAPGGLVSVWGTGMSPVSVVASQIPLPTALGESCLSVAGTPVPLLFVSSKQINAQLPTNVLGPETVTVHTPGGVSNTLNFTVTSTAPAVFMSASAGPTTGLATVVRAANNQVVDATNPIRQGDTLVIWLTGMGLTTPAVAAGSASPSTPLALAKVQPTVTLGGIDLTVDYAGRAPGEVGVDQINVDVPFGVPQGASEPLVITQSTGTTTLNFRVVGN